MRELASLGVADAFLSKVGTFADVLVFAVETLLAVSQHGEVAAHAFSSAHPNMRERAVGPRASALVREVHAQRSTLRSRVMGKRASRSGVRAIPLQEGPADRNLGRIMLIRTSQASSACSCDSKL